MKNVQNGLTCSSNSLIYPIAILYQIFNTWQLQNGTWNGLSALVKERVSLIAIFYK